MAGSTADLRGHESPGVSEPGRDREVSTKEWNDLADENALVLREVPGLAL